MKKVLMILIGAMLVLSMTGVVVADDLTITGEEYTAAGGSEYTEEVTVTLVISDSFTVTILPDFKLEKNTKGWNVYNGDVKADVTLILEDHFLNVYLSGSNPDDGSLNWRLIDNGDDADPSNDKDLEYVVKKGANSADHIEDFDDSKLIQSGSCILSASNADPDDAATLHFRLKDPVTATGSYKDTLKFTVMIEGSEGSELFVNPSP